MVLTVYSTAQRCSFLANNHQMIRQVDPIKGLPDPTAAGHLENIVITGTGMETEVATHSGNDLRIRTRITEQPQMDADGFSTECAMG
jgi:hypothetical protein